MSNLTPSSSAKFLSCAKYVVLGALISIGAALAFILLISTGLWFSIVVVRWFGLNENLALVFFIIFAVGSIGAVSGADHCRRLPK